MKKRCHKHVLTQRIKGTKSLQDTVQIGRAWIREGVMWELLIAVAGGHIKKTIYIE